MKKRETVVAMSGLPGNMPTKIVEHILRADKEKYPFTLCPHALTGPEVTQKTVTVCRKKIKLYPPDRAEEFFDAVERFEDTRPVVIVDYTHASAIENNVQMYCAEGIPFVMGTTGGDEKWIKKIVRETTNCAIVGPNASAQIVVFQAMMTYVATTFPDIFCGFTLEVVESHQKGKKDTSGTAKAIVNNFNAMGIPFTFDQIKKIREPGEQRAMGVPEEYLTGHAWHTYTVRAPDGNVFFQFTHNVNGRDTYALGTLDLINFLMNNIQIGKTYSVIDCAKKAQKMNVMVS